MLFLDIQRDVWSRLNKPNPPDPQTQARIKAFINQRHRTLLTMPGLNQLRRTTFSVPVNANQALVAMPPGVNRIDAIIDPTNRRRLAEREVDWLRTIDPGTITSGVPTVFVAISYLYPSALAAPAELWVVSSSPLDTGVVRVEVRHGDNLTLPVSATMQGQTLTFLDGGVHFLAKAFVSAPAIGLIQFWAAASPGPVMDKVLATIPPGQVRPYQYLIQLWPTPTQATTYLVDAQHTIRDLVEDTDEPMLPEDFHDLLSIGARQDEYEKTDDDRFRTAVAEWNQRYAALQYFLQGRQSRRIIPYGMGGRTGWNNVNSWAPPDFYL